MVSNMRKHITYTVGSCSEWRLETYPGVTEGIREHSRNQESTGLAG